MFDVSYCMYFTIANRRQKGCLEKEIIKNEKSQFRYYYLVSKQCVFKKYGLLAPIFTFIELLSSCNICLLNLGSVCQLICNVYGRNEIYTTFWLEVETYGWNRELFR
jgi:hypothetical protein